MILIKKATKKVGTLVIFIVNVVDISRLSLSRNK